MAQKYNQEYNELRGMLAITKGSFKAIIRNPSAVAFSFGFPMVFILVFGFIGGGPPSVSVALGRQGDSASRVIRGLLQNPLIRLSSDTGAVAMTDLQRGRIAAIITVDSVPSQVAADRYQYTIHTQTSSASADKYPILRSALAREFEFVVESVAPKQYLPLLIDQLPQIPGREYSEIDFILPGMLGFSLLSAAVFGVAFLFFSLRTQLVLKRYYATPIAKRYIVFGEGLARVMFQLITAIVIIGIGKLIFHFTLVHGWLTFAEMLVLSLFGLIVFMGFGFIISSTAKSESTIPPFANLFTLPQFLLGGTFFSTEAFPKWLQRFCEILPLKQLNDAMRNVAFEGAHLTDCWKQLGILALWGVATYAVAIRIFKWE
jgi:ABC-2 type transport system permease protein